MKVQLRSIRDCFEGVIPSIIATLDREGIPNVSYLSQVHFVDDEHVALSNQFFSKTARNVEETGQASVLVVDGRTGVQYELDLEFDHAVHTGETFARIEAHIAAAAQNGAHATWGLRSADIYRVRECQLVLAQPESPPEPSFGRSDADLLAATAKIAARLAEAGDADSMIDGMLDALEAECGYANILVLLAGQGGEGLTTIASRGYRRGGVGSEVEIGRGAIGVAAEKLQPVRISDMSRGRRYAAAVVGEGVDMSRVIPLPGLPEPQSQLAVPMIWQGGLRGVLFAEDARRSRFTRSDEDALSIVALQLASCLDAGEADAAAVGGEAPLSRSPAGGRAFHVRYHTFDDSLFIDDANLIKGVPGRLLFHLLQIHRETGRTDFSNRELRLEAGLRLPELKDNLEARLILLRRRLDEKAAPVRLTRPERGVLRLELAGPPRLEAV